MSRNRSSKAFVAALAAATFLVATVPATAQEAVLAPSAPPSKAPMFIARGTPLSAQETASLSHRMVFNGRISHDLGGDGDEDNITKADEVFVGIIVVAVIAGLVYITVMEAEGTSKLF